MYTWEIWVFLMGKNPFHGKETKKGNKLLGTCMRKYHTDIIYIYVSIDDPQSLDIGYFLSFLPISCSHSLK